MKNIIYLLSLISMCCFGQKKQIHKIVFKGLKHTKASFVKKIMRSKEGEELNINILNQDLQRIKRLPACANAEYTLSTNNKQVKIIVKFDENFTLIPNVSIWQTVKNRVAFKVGLNEYNFLGRNINISSFYQYNGFNSIGFQLNAPHFVNKNFGISLSYQHLKSEEPLYFQNNQSANYEYKNESIEGLILCELSFAHRIRFGVNYFNEDYQYIEGFTIESVPQQLNLNKLLYKLGHTYDNLEYHYFTIKGFKNNLIIQNVSNLTKNNMSDFKILMNDSYYYKKIGNKGNWASHIELGIATNRDSPFSPFVVDNNHNVRGVGNLVTRGSGIFVVNSEYRYTLYEREKVAIQTNGFIDIAFLRPPGQSLDKAFKTPNSHYHSGIGLRFIHKKIFNAIFRIDYGISLQNSRTNGIVFGIGQYF